MIRPGVFMFYALLLFLFRGVTSLRDVQLIVEPPIVIRGGTAALICSRDMQGSPLYSVKWYRGNHEFYRYTPSDNPITRSFSIPGIFVDTNNSNGSQVLLRRLDLTLAGNFSCEVTAEGAPFSTQIATKVIEVIAPPSKDPVLVSNKDRYTSGEVLVANCSSSPSRPPVNLTIYINDEPHRSSVTSLHPTETGLVWTNVNVELTVTQDQFIGGRLRVSCVASIYHIYRSTATADFFTPETDPRPERITFSSATKRLQSWFLVFLLLLLPLLIMGQDLDDYTFDYVLQYYDGDSEGHAIRSMVGG